MAAGRAIPAILWTLVGGGLVIAGIAAMSNRGPVSDSDGRPICQSVGEQKVTKILDIANSTGLLPGRRGAITEVDESVWAALPHDSKVAATFALFCRYEADSKGQGTILLRGYRDGETKASMTDGNYLD